MEQKKQRAVCCGLISGYGLREGPTRRWITITDDNIDKSSAPRGGGSVGRGALNLLLRGFTYRRPQTFNLFIYLIARP